METLFMLVLWGTFCAAMGGIGSVIVWFITKGNERRLFTFVYTQINEERERDNGLFLSQGIYMSFKMAEEAADLFHREGFSYKVVELVEVNT